MQRSAFESFHPWVIFGYLAAVLAVTMSTMHPVMIVTSFVISLVYSLFLCGRVVWKRSVMTGLGVAVFTMGILPLFRHNGATPLFYINDMAVTRENILFGGMMTLLLLAVLQWFYVWNELFGAEKIMVSDRAFLPCCFAGNHDDTSIPAVIGAQNGSDSCRGARDGIREQCASAALGAFVVVVRGFDRDIDSDGNERLWDRQEIFVSFVSLSEAGCSHARGFCRSYGCYYRPVSSSESILPVLSGDPICTAWSDVFAAGWFWIAGNAATCI